VKEDRTEGRAKQRMEAGRKERTKENKKKYNRYHLYGTWKLRFSRNYTFGIVM
jgi:hypothetical protein